LAQYVRGEDAMSLGDFDWWVFVLMRCVLIASLSMAVLAVVVAPIAVTVCWWQERRLQRRHREAMSDAMRQSHVKMVNEEYERKQRPPCQKK
jgi:hypothetical protein